MRFIVETKIETLNVAGPRLSGEKRLAVLRPITVSGVIRVIQILSLDTV